MKEPFDMATIALVDDDRNILTSVSIALESEGYRVETYTDGASALEGLSARPPNLAPERALIYFLAVQRPLA